MGRIFLVPRWVAPCLAAALGALWHAAALGQPTITSAHSAIYDPLRQRMIVFGGSTGSATTNEAWQLTLGGDPLWTLLAPGGNLPSNRFGHSAVYDPVRDRMLVFGGQDDSGVKVNEVWALSLSNPPGWSFVQPDGTPPPGRLYHTAIYDPRRDRMLIYGGQDPSYQPLNDVWSLSLTPTPKWEQLTPRNPPSLTARYGHSAIYDPVRDRMLVFGGFPPNTSQTWALSLVDTTWSLLNPSTAPPPRVGPAAAYDPDGDRMLIFGGQGNQPLNDVWQLSLTTTAWSEVTGTGIPPNLPTTRGYSSAVYDSLYGRMVIFGGYPPVAEPTWALSLGAAMRWSPLRPLIDVSPAALQLPTVTIGDTVSVSFAVANRGMTRLQVSGFRLPTSNPGMRLSTPAPLSPAWNEAVTETLVLAASTPWSAPDSLVIVSNDPLEPRKRVSLSLDVRGLEFDTRALAPAEAPLAESLTVIVRPEDGVRIDGGTFYYRIAGSAGAFDSRPLAPLTPNVNDYFVSGVPASAVTERGVEYYVTVENSGYSATEPPAAPAAFFTQGVAPPASMSAVPVPTSGSDFLEGRDIEVQVLLPAGSSFVSGAIHFRRGGDPSYESAPLTIGPSSGPIGTIPAGVVGPRGVEYWVEASTLRSALRFPSTAPAAAIIRIRVQNLAEESEHPGGRYRMLSVPVDFGADFAGSLDALLTDQFGTYNTVNWRTYWYGPDPPGSIEFSPAIADSFRLEPGRAFWLISRQAHRVDTNPIAGFSTATDADYAVDLRPGWNQFGNPFDFPVAWADVRMTPNVADSAVAFDGLLGTIGDYAPQKPVFLKPFEGYFIHATAAGTLWVPPIAAPTPASGNDAAASRVTQTQSSAPAASVALGDLWRYGLRAWTEQATDGSNTFGAHAAAKSDFDPLDDLKPPSPPGPWVRIAFVHPEWRERSGQYRRDLRAPNTDGETWEIELRSATAGEPVTVDLTEIIAPLSDLSIRLIDREQGTSIDASRAAASPPGSAVASAGGQRSVAQYRMLSYGLSPYRLAIVAGSTGYVSRVTEQTLATPSRVTLDPGAPNPFRAAARIRFGLPRAQRATLEVYNVLGQRVATLLDQAQLPPGYHTAIWDGRLRSGGEAPSGVYFLRLVAGQEALTHRIVRIQ